MLVNRITVIMISFLSCLIFGCDDDSTSQSVGDQGQGMRTIVDAQIQQDVAVVAADTGTQSADASSQDDAGLIVMDASSLGILHPVVHDCKMRQVPPCWDNQHLQCIALDLFWTGQPFLHPSSPSKSRYPAP